MKVYLLLGAIAMALTILLTPVVRWTCLRFNILPPLRGRDHQKTPIPRLAGVAMPIALPASPTWRPCLRQQSHGP